MPITSTAKMYHRGNNDATSPNTLTSIMLINLSLDAQCEEDTNSGSCAGTVKAKLKTEFSSPPGVGNGDPQSGPIASRFGLRHGGVFTRFNGGAVPANPLGSEHWSVSQEIEIGDVPCAGGTLTGRVEVADSAAAAGGGLMPADYFIDYEIEITRCGNITKQEVNMTEGAALSVIGPGGRITGIFQEVHSGDPLPFPPKAGTPAGGLQVGPDGTPQPVPAPAPAPNPPAGGGNSNCFIATAVYGAESSEVSALRKFRDDKLQKNYAGQIFIKIYYLFSPPIASLIRRSDTLHRFTKVILNWVYRIIIDKKKKGQ